MSNETVLITGTLQDSRTQETAWQQQALGVKVLVKISMQNWFAVVKHVSSIRIRNAPLICTDTAPIIDTTTGSSVVSGNILTRADECIQVAEVFAGGGGGGVLG